MSGRITQTAALFLDAYRDLNARKLFWISLMISAVLVVAFAAVGLNDRGMTLFWWTFPSDFLNATKFSPALLYKFIFTSIAIPFWLAWGATILALVSTSSIVPDFLAGGAIELTLSKPISRLRLILTKFATALLFAGLQTAVFSAACFLVIGLRGHSWEPRLFLAVPILLLFFSYLYCICTLLGLVTRSTIASLLLTILIWLAIAGVHGTEGTFLYFKVRNELKEQKILGYIEALNAQLERQNQDAAKLTDQDPPRMMDAVTLAQAATRNSLADREKQLKDTRASAPTIERGHQVAYALKTMLPKTAETVALLNRALLSPADTERFKRPDERPSFSFTDDVRVSDQAIGRRLEEIYRGRTVGWVVGTSAVFELLVLLLCVRIFVRRDF